MKVRCAHCGKLTEKEPNAVNRAKREGNRLFCDKKCSAAGRRKNKTKPQRKEEKRLYDAVYRVKNREILKAKKHAYFVATYDPEAARIERKKRSKQHVEYCRRPEYRKWKVEYDRQYRASDFGPFAEAYLTLLDLNREIKGRMTNYEIRSKNGTINKRQERRRQSQEVVNRDRSRSSDG